MEQSSATYKMALFLAFNNIPVFPCNPGSKEPATPNGFYRATIDPAQIDMWWERNPNYNLAVPCGNMSGIVALDVDCHTVDGLASYEKLLDMLGGLDVLDEYPQETTPNNGIHVFFHERDLPTIRKFTQFDLPGIELRGEGSYVVVAPSRIGDKVYQWLPGKALGASIPMAMPDKLRHMLRYQVEALAAPSSPEKRTFGHIVLEQEHIEGSRNDAIYKYGCDLRGRGYDEYEIVENCIDYNNRWCLPPLEEREVVRTALSASRRPKGDRGTIFIPYEGEDDGEEVPEAGSCLFSIAHKEFDPLPWIVQDLIAPGATQLPGHPKVGKSWLCLQLCVAVATGGTILGRQCLQSKVLYFALEDDERRIHSRLHKQNIFDGLEPDMVRVVYYRDFATYFRDLGTSEGRRKLMQQVKQFGYKLVIVDVLSRGFPSMKQNEIESVTNALSPLQTMARDMDFAILIVDHKRKGPAGFIVDDAADHLNEVGGSRGKPACYDSTISLERPRHERKGLIRVTGREGPDFKMPVNFNEERCLWELGTKRDTLSKSMSLILDAIDKLGDEATPQNILDEVNVKLSDTDKQKDKGNLSRQLTRMVDSKIVERKYIKKQCCYVVGPDYRQP